MCHTKKEEPEEASTCFPTIMSSSPEAPTLLRVFPSEEEEAAVPAATVIIITSIMGRAAAAGLAAQRSYCGCVLNRGAAAHRLAARLLCAEAGHSALHGLPVFFKQKTAYEIE
eukprot:COSAG01_NODE_4943_length_4605_cov_11.292943_1_plen_113_part_00